VTRAGGPTEPPTGRLKRGVQTRSLRALKVRRHKEKRVLKQVTDEKDEWIGGNRDQNS